MVIDSSAIIAILFGEPEAAQMDRAIRTAPVRLISVATVLEIVVVLTRRLEMDARPVVDRTRAEYELTVVDMDIDQMNFACDAMVRFGKGRHAARLNYGDCFAYALSRSSGEPLLFKGEDFTRTDLIAA